MTPRARASADAGIELAVRKNNGKLLSEDVRVNVAWPHFFQDQVFVGSLRSRPEIEHDRTIRENAAFNGAVNRSPGHVFCIPRSTGPVVGSFYSHNEVGILLNGVDTKLYIHLVQSLLKPTAHPIRHDVQESQHAHSGAVNDFFLFLEERLGTGGAGIYDGGHTGLQRQIGRNSKWQSMRPRVGREPV